MQQSKTQHNLFREKFQSPDLEIQLIGSSITSNVFKLTQLTGTQKNIQYAAKVVENSSVVYPKALQLLQNEYKILKQLQSPFIIQVFDLENIQKEDGLEFYCLQMQLCRSDLYNQIHKYYPKIIARKSLKHYFRDIAKALIYIHQLDLIHFDIRPQNFLLKDKNALLGDFGYSTYIKEIDNQKFIEIFQNKNKINLPPEGALLLNMYQNTPQFEQILKQIDWKAFDMYGLGVALFKCIFLFNPFQNKQLQQYWDECEYDKFWNYTKNITNILNKIEHAEQLKNLLQSCMNIDSHKRLTAQQFLDHLWIKH